MMWIENIFRILPLLLAYFCSALSANNHLPEHKCARPIPDHPPMYRYFKTQPERNLTIFDTEFYQTLYHHQLEGMSPYKHFVTKGMFEGKRTHRGMRILKIILLTKDEWPILKWWILYHGDRFGFENLYILDGSERLECIEFLKMAETKWKVNVIRTNHGLNELEQDLTNIMLDLAYSSDYVTKLDTDEFIALNAVDISKGPFLLHGMTRELDRIVYDGRIVKFGYTTLGWPNQTICEARDGLNNTDLLLDKALYFTEPIPTTFKSILPSISVTNSDLGNHRGDVHPDFTLYDCMLSDGSIQSIPPTHHVTNLSIIHFHFGCFEEFIANTEKAVVSHRYIKGNETREEKIHILAPLIADFTKECNINSCHKVANYVEYLNDTESCKTKYYATMPTNTIYSRVLALELKKLDIKYFG